MSEEDEWKEKSVPLLAEEAGISTAVQVSSPGNSDGEEDKPEAKINFLEDDPREMTIGRRIALSLMDKTWYNPRAGMVDDDATVDSDLVQTTEPETRLKRVSSSFDDDFDEDTINTQPSIANAWAYFEHIALYRYLVPDNEKEEKKKRCSMCFGQPLERAEPGEDSEPTKLYHPIHTPHSQLGDFGLGIGLYFTSLRAMTFVTLVAGFISLYNIIYFASDEYQPYKADASQSISLLQKGSAICEATSWVPCTDCVCHNGTYYARFGEFPADRCAKDASYPDLTFVLRNDCDGTPWQLAACNYAAVVFVLIAVVALGYFVEKATVEFDEDEQTAQDYSISISNPPKDALDPDEWFRFFKENFDGAHATVITIARDNDLLVKTLVRRRELLRTIQYAQPAGSSIKILDLARSAAEQERDRTFLQRLKALFIPGLPEHFAKIVALNAKVSGLAQLEFPVTHIFVTFETEADQRRVLNSLSVGALRSSRNDIKAVSDSKFLFRGRHVLAVTEPDEPNTIRWQDLNAGHWQKMKQRILTFICTLIAVVMVASIVDLANDSSPLGAAFTISIFNSLFPMFAKMLTNLESHASESSKQSSLYFKICFFRWINTAIVITLITPFTHTLENKTGLVTQVYALFFADIVTTNAIQLTDPLGHIKRHIMGPRAQTPDAMYLLFQGSPYELAERYTDMSKILFLCFWYNSIFPGSFFMCSLSLGIKYLVDRFSLMRTWMKAPNLGNSIARSSSRVFFPLATAAMAVLSSYYWTGFPYDNICVNDGSINENFVNTFTLTPIDGEPSVTVTYSNDDHDYRYCNMNMLALAGGFTFPFVPTTSSDKTQPKEWMTDEQIVSTTYFGWSAVVILCIIAVIFLIRGMKNVLDLFQSSYKPVGDDQGEPYSSVESRSAYIPQVKSNLFPYPLLAFNTTGFDEELYDFTDPERTYRFYDITKDAKKLLSTLLKGKEPPGFSLMKHYPPPSKKLDYIDLF